MNLIKRIRWVLFALLAIMIGLYPALYFFIDKKFGLLSTKDQELFQNTIWNFSFYIHIILGGLALLIGWIQFSKEIRATRLKLHRQTGKVYVVSASLSALSGLYIAVYATGGLITAIGFFCLGVLWFYTTLRAYLDVRKGNIADHEKMMIYSYALCFAAVTLRIWLPLLVIWRGEFIPAYKIVAWLCWVPNLLVAFLIVNKIKNRTLIARHEAVAQQ